MINYNYNNNDKEQISNKSKDKLTSNKITLQNYIKSKKTQFGDKSLTHQWWDNDTNTNFKIDDEEYDDFLKIYIKELKNTTDNNVLHIMEQPMEIGPLCLDFDFKQTTPERTICVDNIMHIVGIINNIVAMYFGIKDKNILNSYVLMKTEPFYNKKKLLYSDGFHLQYPNLILNSVDRFLIYQESRKEIIRQDLFSNVYSVLVKVNNYKQTNTKKSDNLNKSNKLNNQMNDFDSDYSSDMDDVNSDREDINDYYTLNEKEKEKINDEIFDPCVIIKNKWFLYGSGKNIEGDINIYHLAYIFDYNIDEIEDKPTLKELVKLLSIRKPTNKSNQINPKQSHEYDELIEQVKLKYIKKTYDKTFDINKLFIKSPYSDNQDNIETNTNKKILDFAKNIYNKTPTEQENINYARELVKLLNKERSVPYEEWISVGWCLYNISPSLYPEFLEFSKLAGKKFDKNGCEKVWEDCHKRNNKTGYSIPSLIKWAKEDNPEYFKQLLRKKLNKSLDGRDLRTDFDVAYIVYEYYKYDFVCSGIEKKVWWEFNNDKWNRIDCAYSLSIKLSTELTLELAQLNYEIVKLAALEQNSQAADILQKKSKTIMDLIFNLKKSSFKDKIIKEASGLYIQKDFESKLDQNIYLIGFANGVYDLKNKIFRKGEPNDLIRKHVGYDYKTFERDDPIIKEIEAFLESIQPEKDMRDYLCAYIASFLEGSNKDQKFMIWTGCHALNQGILMADGTVKKVQDIKIGEQLMGDDSKPRNVVQLIRGNDIMCEIIPDRGNKFKVNLDHILSLMTSMDTFNCSWSEKNSRFKIKWHSLENNIPICKYKSFHVKRNKMTLNKNRIYYDSKKLAEIAVGEFKKELIFSNNIIKKGDIIDMSVKDYLKYSKLFYENYLLFKTDIKYDEKKLDVEPYLIGYWLGDGSLNKNSIIIAEKEIFDYFTEIVSKYGLTLDYESDYHYYINSCSENKESNYFLTCLEKYNLKNKHIPKDFLFNSRENRLKLLAGIIDSEAHYHNNLKQYEIIFKSKKLFEDVLFLVRSLGFDANTYDDINNDLYFKMTIFGMDINEIPSLLERKQHTTPKIINNNLTKFVIKILDKEDYYGFRVDGNNRYLMDDFTVTHNCGQNGKGSLIDLIDNTFNGSDDGYFATLPPTVLTQKRGSSSAATPELATKFGKRVIVLQEPEGDDKINVGFMKNITGQDKIEARPLYGDPFQFTPLFKLLLACNHLPSIFSDDGGTWRRIRVIDFMIKYCNNPKGPNERKTDNKLREKIKKWNQGFMWLLLEIYYPMYVLNDGLDKLEPDRVKLATDKYKADTNPIMEFFDELLENDNESDIVLNDIYESFKVWYVSSYNDKKIIQRKKFKEYFDTTGYKVTSVPGRGIVIKGIKIKELNVLNENNINDEFDDM